MDRCNDAGWNERDRLVAFEQVLGQTFPVERLSERVREKRTRDPILLYGPKGAGKKALASLYAVAVQCRNPRPSGSPCLACEPCMAATTGEGLTYILHHDGAISDTGANSFPIARIVQSSSIGTWTSVRWVFIISNADRIATGELDRLLTMLETETLATAVFLAENRSAVSPTILSRCDRLAIMPLDRATAADRLKKICERENVQYAPEALEIISLQAKRGAGALFHHLWHVAQGGSVSLERTRDAFDLGWPCVAQLAWLAMLGGDRHAAVTHTGQLASSAPEALRRLRVFLAGLQQFCDPASAAMIAAIDPALLFRSRSEFAPVVDLLQKRAAEQGVKLKDLLSSITAYWATCDAQEPIGLTQAVRNFQRRILSAG